jgi:excisionase family DNA binding protein
MKTEHNPEFLTLDDAAQLAGLSHWTIRRMLQTKRLARYKSGQRTFVSRTELLERLKPTKVTEAAR